MNAPRPRCSPAPLAAVALLALALSTGLGCRDFLEDELLSETSADFLYNTPEGLEAGVVGLYALARELDLDGEWNNARSWTLTAKSDIAFGRTGEISLYSRLAWGREVGDFGAKRFSRFWRHYYRVADRANAVIAGLERDGALDPERRDQLLAEARMFRAEAYFTLYRLFNNIFVTTEPTTPENVFTPPSRPSTPEEIFALVDGDLEFAIANLAAEPEAFGRYTEGTARHVRAKTAMWQGDYATAAAQAEAVIEGGVYRLVPNTRFVFVNDLKNTETLFARQLADGIVGGGRRNNIHFNVIPQYNSIRGATHSIENGGRGTGLLMPNGYLLDLLAEDEGDTRDDDTYYKRYYLYNDPERLPDGVSFGDTIRTATPDSDDPNVYQTYYRTQNPGVLKFLSEDADPTEASNVKNLIVYRLAETYLIAAEAHWRLGDDARGLQRLNAIRERAGAAPADAIDLRAVMDERARELAFEGQRWYFLKRTNTLVSQIQQHAGNDNFRNEARERIEPRHRNWSIPESELSLLGAGYPQNEGY